MWGEEEEEGEVHRKREVWGVERERGREKMQCLIPETPIQGDLEFDNK